MSNCGKGLLRMTVMQGRLKEKKEYTMGGKTASWEVLDNRKRELLVFWLLAAAICVMRLWHISELRAPIVYNDEIGYWSHAANLAGLFWTETESAWYSYGYSLLLVPLFWITHNMEILYRLAIGENVLLGVIGFWAGFRILRELDQDLNKIVAMFISFVAATYSAYVFQSNIAWTETFLYTWFLITALLAIRFCKRPTYGNTVLLTLATAFLYLIHNRTLAVWVALLMTVVYMLFRRQISWKHVLLMVGILAVVYMANKEVKVYLNALMWGSEKSFKGNSVSAQSGKLKLLTSVAGIKRLLRSLAGKVWYLFSSTFLVGYLGMVYLLKGFIKNVRKKTRKGLDSAYLFLGLSVLGTLAVAMLGAVPKNIAAGGSYSRLDTLFYGRYSDMVTGMLIMLGLMGLYQGCCRRRSIRSVFMEAVPGLIVYGVCLVVIQIYFSGIGDYAMNVPCVPGVFFRGAYTSNAISFKQITAIASFLFVLILLGFQLFRLRFEKIGAGLRCLLVGLGMICVFWKTANNAYQLYIENLQTKNYNNYSEGVELLNANTQYQIYCKGLGKNHYTLRQYLRVTVVEGDFTYSASDEENYFLIADLEDLENVDFSAKNYYYVQSFWEVQFLVVGDEIAENLESQGYACIPVESLEEIEALAADETLADSETLTSEETEADTETSPDAETST
ncbi:MAG: hypothetical protein LIO99_13695 [Clostridiales bacterium]|nr:hypothetical protein [Clostridiales bacterium]